MRLVQTFPKKLAKLVEFKPVKAGIYEIVAVTNKVRIIVLSEVPQEKHNAFWYLYSARANKVAFGANNYQWHTENMSRIINQLFQRYGLEGINVPYTMEDFNREYVKERISSTNTRRTLRRTFCQGTTSRTSCQGTTSRASCQGTASRTSHRRNIRAFVS